MPRKKQIIKVKKTQKQKQKVSVVVNVNSNNKRKNVVSRQPKMIQSSAAPQVIYIQAPAPQSASSNVNDRFSVPSTSPHINEKVLDKTPPPPTAAVDPVTTDPRLRAEPPAPKIERRPKATTRGVALFTKALEDLPPAVSDEEISSKIPRTPVISPLAYTATKARFESLTDEVSKKARRDNEIAEIISLFEKSLNIEERDVIFKMYGYNPRGDIQKVKKSNFVRYLNKRGIKLNKK